MKQSESSSELLKSILQSAEAEARTTLETADSRAEETVDSAREKAARILNEADKKALAHRKEVKKNSGSSLNLLQSRQELKNSQKLYIEVQNRVKRRLKDLSESDSYRALLKGFVMEATLGLGESSEEGDFIINGGSLERDLMNSGFLKEVKEELKKRFGEDHSFVLFSGPALPEQGVEITDRSGRRAFRNSFSARMLRYEKEIRELIDTRLYNEETL
jgi:vacuolar-type H+-ATPase subunit E/Vma4